MKTRTKELEMSIEIKAGLITTAIVAAITLFALSIGFLMKIFGGFAVIATLSCLLSVVLIYVAVHASIDPTPYNKHFKK